MARHSPVTDAPMTFAVAHKAETIAIPSRPHAASLESEDGRSVLSSSPDMVRTAVVFAEKRRFVGVPSALIESPGNALPREIKIT